jgi:hypothetical protein
MPEHDMLLSVAQIHYGPPQASKGVYQVEARKLWVELGLYP